MSSDDDKKIDDIMTEMKQNFIKVYHQGQTDIENLNDYKEQLRMITLMYVQCMKNKFMLGQNRTRNVIQEEQKELEQKQRDLLNQIIELKRQSSVIESKLYRNRLNMMSDLGPITAMTQYLTYNTHMLIENITEPDEKHSTVEPFVLPDIKSFETTSTITQNNRMITHIMRRILSGARNTDVFDLGESQLKRDETVELKNANTSICTTDGKDMCPICQDKLMINTNIITTKCNHMFHAKCLSEWVKYKNTCPVCVADINTESKM